MAHGMAGLSKKGLSKLVSDLSERRARESPVQSRRQRDSSRERRGGGTETRGLYTYSDEEDDVGIDTSEDEEEL